MGRYRELLLLGWAIWSIGMGLMSTLTEASNLSRQIGYSKWSDVGERHLSSEASSMYAQCFSWVSAWVRPFKRE